MSACRSPEADALLVGTDAAMRVLVQMQAMARELIQAQRNADHLAQVNSEQCDEIHELREENARLRAELEAKR